ncbi:MAG: ammonia-dependent NAD(+) synthetase [Neptunomonas phycophila]|uniref:ammonia-dependent NAD(+) synthetase n=1 Tax=Neptunomonas phycophila TaxID=1572645 RepID=UPI003B8CEEA3
MDKNTILNDLGVERTEDFDVKRAIRQRIDYLKDYVLNNNVSSIVLGISGGVDSTTAGRLAQIAMDELAGEHQRDYKFIAVRLPSHVQADEAEAQTALDFIEPNYTLTLNVGPLADLAIDTVNSAIEQEFGTNMTDELFDFTKGNIKARSRMIMQYAVAGIKNGLVLGTDHNAEAVMGFYTKYGDGGCDILVLNGLNKRQVRLVAKELGAPEVLYSKVATADLEEDKPQIPDEVALGVTYDDIDDFLEGKEVSPEAEVKIIAQYTKTVHKREMPVGFTSHSLQNI